MTISSVLRDTWVAIEAEPQSVDGIYHRRVHADSGFHLFAGLLYPSRCLRLSVEVARGVLTDGLERETQGFKVHRQYDAAARTTHVFLDLSNLSFRRLFEAVADDVLAGILLSRTEAEAVSAMRGRLNHWERFMRSAGAEGLSREAQVGLFGELTFLKTLLCSGIDASSAIGWWKGPASENQDFRAGLRGVEVKTVTTNSGTSIRVANELQLDNSDTRPLFLLLVWLREVDGGGQSLPQLVDEIAATVGPVAEPFLDQLIEAGYHEVHRELYERSGYLERDRRYYAVEDGFPCLRRSDLRPGVSHVQYRVDLAGFERFLRTEPQVIQGFSESSL